MNLATQSEIARTLGLSRATVAAALNSNSKITLRSETREKVQNAARELGYRPNRYAQIMRKKRSGLIGFITETGLLQPSADREFVASRAIQEAGFGLATSKILWDWTGLRRAVDAMLDAHVEGVLLGGIAIDPSGMDELQRLRNMLIPIVYMGGNPTPAIPAVIADVQQGMRELTQHVLSLGYRKLVLATTTRLEDYDVAHTSGFTGRLHGFREAVAAAGLNESQARIFHCQPENSQWSDHYAAGRAALRSLAEGHERPEVLLCENDHRAIGAIRAATDVGWRTPGDIAITGFDDTTAGRYSCPALTTVAQPSEAMAQRAVELLLKQVRGEPISESERLIKLPCQVVVRESCGANR